jgi:hypothetical protein
MRDQVRRIPAMGVLVLATIMLVGTLPAMGAAPQPVIPVPPGEGPKQPPPGEPPPGEPEPEPDPGCLLGPTGGVAAAGPLASLSHARGILATYPGPVVPIEQASDCEAQVSMSLVVESPRDQKPEGADAALDELAVSRASLESGFEVTLPAGSRTITLSDPGEDWELTSVACTCSGGSAVAVAIPGAREAPVGILASYPQPVIPISLVTPGSADCGGGSASGGPAAEAAGERVASKSDQASAASAMSVSPTRPGTGQLLTYPGPVLPVPPADGSDTPTPPTRRPGSVSWDQDGRVSIRDDDAAGGIFSCVWTVELVYGELALETKTRPSGREGQFTYRVTPDAAGIGKIPVSMRGVPPANTEKLWNGSWSVELADLEEAWEVERSDCRETDSATASSAAGTTASVGVDPADRVRCTFELKLLAPKPGSWRARNGAATASCGPVDFKLPVSTDRGRMRVQRDGDVLILRGSGSGSNTTWRLERDQQDLLRYRGTVSMTMAGVRGTFKTDVRLISEKQMKGTLSGKAQLRGTSCSFSRPVTLTYAGG